MDSWKCQFFDVATCGSHVDKAGKFFQYFVFFAVICPHVETPLRDKLIIAWYPCGMIL